MPKKANNSEKESQTLLESVKKILTVSEDEPRYYHENFLYIRTQAGGSPIKLKYRAAQKIFYRRYMQLKRSNRPVRMIVLKSRKVGISTLVEAEAFRKTVSHQGHNTKIVSQDKNTAGTIFEMNKLYYDMLVPELRPMTKYRTKEHFMFENPSTGDYETVQGLGSKISLMTAKNAAGSRGETNHFVHFSEFAFYNEYAEPLFDSVSNTMRLVPGTVVVIESTANGEGGMFHGMWEQAIEDEKNGDEDGFIPIFIPWIVDPDCRMPITEKIIDVIRGSLTEEERELIDRYKCTWDQLAWRRSAIKIQAHGNMDKFHQEFPLCLIGETRISTQKGIIRLNQAENGLISESGTILGYYPQGEQSVIEITTAMGRHLTGTLDHPIEKTDGTFVNLSDSIGAEIQLRMPRFSERVAFVEWNDFGGITSRLTMNEEWARFLGYFMGDGSFSSPQVSICCDAKDKDVIEDVSRLMTYIFGTVHAREVGPNKGGVELRSYSKNFELIMKKLGIYNPKVDEAGNHGPRRKVCVPEVIFRSPKHIVREFLMGLFEADGFNGYRTNRVILFSKSIKFLEDIQLLLLGFGVNAPVEIHKRRKPNYDYIANEIVFKAEAAIQFNKEIGFVSHRKKYRGLGNVKRGANRHKMTMTDKVVSVKPAGIQEVYDLHIEGRHTFSANGIVAHNTWRSAFVSTGHSCFDKEALKHFSVMVKAKAQSDKPGMCGFLDGGLKNTRFIPSNQGNLVIYKMPEQGKIYFIGGDPCQGRVRSDNPDYGVLCVLSQDMEQCAQWRGIVDPTIFCQEAMRLGFWYNTAMLNIEANTGWATVSQIRYHYPHLYKWTRGDVDTPHKESNYAFFETTGKSVHLLRERLLFAVNMYWDTEHNGSGLKIYDPVTLSELKTFEWHPGSSVLEARGGCHDDTVVALGMALIAMTAYDFGYGIPKGRTGAFVPGNSPLGGPGGVILPEQLRAARGIDNNDLWLYI